MKKSMQTIILLGLFWLPLVHAAIPAPPMISGTSHILLDINSGVVLSESNIDEQVEPASLTKMMTTYVVYSELAQGRMSFTDKVRVSKKAWKMPGSRMFIEVDKWVTVEDLVKGMVIQSGNDASVALAEHVAGSEESFAGLMNEHAKRLGLQNSYFVNSTGLPAEGHLVTARDMAILGGALIRDFPEHYPIHAVRKFTFNGIEQYNRNKLLWRDNSVDGIKTGHTEAAGYCLVASAERKGMRLVTVVMGTDSEQARAREAQKLLNYGFRFYETHRLFKAGETVYQAPVWKGRRDKVDLGLAEDLWLTVPRGDYNKLNASTKLSGKLIAPLQQNQKLADMVVSLDGQELAKQPLYALRKVDKGSLWRRMSDHVKMMLAD